MLRVYLVPRNSSGRAAFSEVGNLLGRSSVPKEVPCSVCPKPVLSAGESIILPLSSSGSTMSTGTLSDGEISMESHSIIDRGENFMDFQGGVDLWPPIGTGPTVQPSFDADDAFRVSVEGKGYDISRDDIASSFANSFILWESYADCVPEFIRVSPTADLAKNLMERVEISKKRFSLPNAIQLARADAADFVLPELPLISDLALLQASGGSLVEAIRAKQGFSKSKGFNAESVLDCLSVDNPHRALALDIATNGAFLDPPEGFIPSSTPDPPRSLSLRLSSCYLKHGYKLHQQGKCMLLRLVDIPPAERNLLHFNNPHWTPKLVGGLTSEIPFYEWSSNEEKVAYINSFFKKEGRFLTDCSNREVGMALNEGNAKELAAERFGKFPHPTIGGIIQKMFNFIREKNCSLGDCVIWKDDIANCFPQFSFDPRTVLLLAVMISDDIALLNTNGVFGHTGCPPIWDGVARPADYELKPQMVNAFIERYCDDYMGFGLGLTAAYNKKLIQDFYRRYMGEDAISIKKSVPPSSAGEFIGWWIDLSLGTIRPNDKGIDKLLFVFFVFDFTESHNSATWSLLASLADRYSRCLRGMSTFVSPFWRMLGKCGVNPHNRKRATSEARFAIEMWRVCASCLSVDKEAFSTALASFDEEGPIDFFPISDASPWKICCGLYSSDLGNPLVAWTTLLLPYQADEKNLCQNSREFLGALLCLILVVVVRRRNGLFGESFIQWTNDNESALKWARRNICKSRATQIGNMSYVWFQLMSKVSVRKTMHIPGISMGDIDAGSRDGFTPSLLPHLYVDLSVFPEVEELFRLCDPSLQVVDHHDAFLSVHRVLGRLLCHFSH
mgnify:CR=1 FL=1